MDRNVLVLRGNDWDGESDGRVHEQLSEELALVVVLEGQMLLRKRRSARQ